MNKKTQILFIILVLALGFATVAMGASGLVYDRLTQKNATLGPYYLIEIQQLTSVDNSSGVLINDRVTHLSCDFSAFTGAGNVDIAFQKSFDGDAWVNTTDSHVVNSTISTQFVEQWDTSMEGFRLHVNSGADALGNAIDDWSCRADNDSRSQ